MEPRFRELGEKRERYGKDIAKENSPVLHNRLKYRWQERGEFTDDEDFELLIRNSKLEGESIQPSLCMGQGCRGRGWFRDASSKCLLFEVFLKGKFNGSVVKIASLGVGTAHSIPGFQINIWRRAFFKLFKNIF